MLDTIPHLLEIPFPTLTRDSLQTLQVNLGYRCNLSCNHCHVNAGPKRTEMMCRETVEQVMAVLEQGRIRQLDLTGGAPELNPYFRALVEHADRCGVAVIDRCNLTILKEPGQEDLAQFLAKHRVEIVASLPCYLQENVDAQRGKGSFEASIDGLRTLNQLGFGEAGSGRLLNLVYNPQGASLPPAQERLEIDYKRELEQRYGVHFNHLLTITNLPIHRFGSQLLSKGEFGAYMGLLRENHQTQNLQTVMCRSLISVDWKGRLYDCDFNQMLQWPIEAQGGALHLSDLLREEWDGRSIRVAGHCYGCTAGQGSSCGGALT